MAASPGRRHENGKKANSGERRVSVESNIGMIEKLFDAFSRGDIESILAALTGDVDWQGLFGVWLWAIIATATRPEREYALYPNT